MDARQFLAEFKHIASAPEGVQKIRELVLQFAISGDLTVRVIGDIFASESIAGNKEEQDKLVAPGQIKRQHLLQKMTESDYPWALPDGWLWCRLGEVTNYGYSPRVELGDVDDQTWILELEDIERGTSRLLQKVRVNNRLFKSAKNRFNYGSILYSKLRPYLDKVLIADEDGVCTTEIVPISFFKNIDPGYLRWYLKSPFFLAYAANSTHGMNLPRLGTNAARNAPFPFPPAQEQQRIVAKVDELMALCDKLEAQQQERETLNQLSYTAVLNDINQAYTKAQLHKAWARLEQSVKGLFTEAESIASLERTVFDLAITGRLAPQNLIDQPVSEFSERISEEKQRLIEAGVVKKVNRGFHALDITGPFHLPQGWIWQRLESLFAVITDGDHQPPPRSAVGVPFVVIGDLNTGRINLNGGRFVPDSYYENLDWARRPTKGDILYTVTGSFGIPVFVDASGKFCVQRHVAIFKSLPSTPTSFLMMFLHSQYAIEYTKSIATGIAQKTVPLSGLRNMLVPVPPEAEQNRILQKAEEISQFCSTLQSQLTSKRTTSSILATTAIGTITGFSTQEQEKMKTPKTELVSKLRIGIRPTNGEQAPLASILARNNDELPAKTLWNMSDLKEIEAFYQQLKIEIAKGWIKKPEPAYVQEVGAS